jgi:hypothetical protein
MWVTYFLVFPPLGAGEAQRPDCHQLLLLQDPGGSQGVDVVFRRVPFASYGLQLVLEAP